MTTTASTQWDNEINQLMTHWNKTANQVFDHIVLQTVQRLGRNISEPITVQTTGAQILTPGNPNIPATSGIRLGIGND